MKLNWQLKLGGSTAVFLINLLALVVLAGALFYLLNQADQLADFYTERTLAERQERDFDRLDQLMTETAAAQAKIDNYFATTQSLPVLIERLESLATSTKVVFDLTDAALVEGKTPMIELAFRATGSFSNLFHFIVLVESLPVRLQLKRAVLVYNERIDNRGILGWSGDFILNLVNPRNNENR